jgi:hypothetical protein
MTFSSLAKSLPLFFFLTTAAQAEKINFVCRSVEYNRIDVLSKWLTAGDSNGRLEFELKGEGEKSGSAIYRFVQDQSSDDTLSIWGLRADARYSEGNGLWVVYSVLKFDSHKEDAKSEPVLNAILSDVNDLEVGQRLKIADMGFFGQKLLKLLGDEKDPSKFDLKQAVKDKKLQQDDLVSVNVGACSLLKSAD